MTPVAAPTKKKRVFDPNAFLATIGKGQKTVTFSKKQAIFAQGDGADAVFYIQEGKVRLTVVSNNGREATVGVLSGGDFAAKAPLPASLCAWDLRLLWQSALFCELRRKP